MSDVVEEQTPDDPSTEYGTSTLPYTELSEGGQDNRYSERLYVSSSTSSMSAFLSAYFSSPDGKELIVCAGCGAFTFLLGRGWISPHQRPIPYQYLEDTGDYVLNQSNNEEMTASTVPFWLVIVLCIILCPMIQIFLSWSYGFIGDVHGTLCVYLLAVPFNQLVTWSIKVYVGYLRPYFYNQCVPDDNFQYCTSDQDGAVWNARMSFPSGHASLSFCGLTLLYLSLERLFGLSSIQRAVVVPTSMQEGEYGATTTAASSTVDQQSQQRRMVLHYKKPPFLHRCYSILCVAPIGLAVFIAASRVVDNKHFPADVIAGSLIGWTIANFFHRLWLEDPRFIPSNN